MNDYERIAALIRYIDEHHARQPSLADLADWIGLSEFHLHRLFQRWAGITPKDFLQALTLEHAKARLQESATVLDAALDAGLSGPGRLHDLFVTIEAASPGEFKSGGSGLTMAWGQAESPFGWCALAWNDRGVCHLSFHETQDDDDALSAIRATWPKSTLEQDHDAARRQIHKIFTTDNGARVPMKALVRGTPFQLKVWRALLRIPEGSLASYRTVAKWIGSPDATRAVGSACGANAIAYLIPCHRVIRETGVVQGYRWGSARKRALLAWESMLKNGTEAFHPHHSSHN